MEYELDTFKERLGRFIKGDDSALDVYKYRISADVSLAPVFPEEVQTKVNKLIHFKEGETLELSKNILKLISKPYDKEHEEYVRFKFFKYDLAFVNTCRLLRINNITTKERLFFLTAIELAKKWKGARTKSKLILNTVANIISMAEILTNDVWCEHKSKIQSERYFDATTLDSKSSRALKYKFCTATIERVRNVFETKFGKVCSDIEIRRWLDGQIVKYIVEYALRMWNGLSKEDILKNIYNEFKVNLCEKTLQNHKGEIVRFKYKKSTKTENQKNKEKEKEEYIREQIELYGKQWKKHVEERYITWYKRHKELFIKPE